MTARADLHHFSGQCFYNNHQWTDDCRQPPAHASTIDIQDILHCTEPGFHIERILVTSFGMQHEWFLGLLKQRIPVTFVEHRPQEHDEMRGSPYTAKEAIFFKERELYKEKTFPDQLPKRSTMLGAEGRTHECVQVFPKLPRTRAACMHPKIILLHFEPDANDLPPLDSPFASSSFASSSSSSSSSLFSSSSASSSFSASSPKSKFAGGFLRLCISSTNMGEADWKIMRQVVWVQDFPANVNREGGSDNRASKGMDFSQIFGLAPPPPPLSSTSCSSFSSSDFPPPSPPLQFASQLAVFLSSLLVSLQKTNKGDTWADQNWVCSLANYDFADASVALVTSVPCMGPVSEGYYRKLLRLQQKFMPHLPKALIPYPSTTPPSTRFAPSPCFSATNASSSSSSTSFSSSSSSSLPCVASSCLMFLSTTLTLTSDDVQQCAQLLHKILIVDRKKRAKQQQEEDEFDGEDYGCDDEEEEEDEWEPAVIQLRVIDRGLRHGYHMKEQKLELGADVDKDSIKRKNEVDGKGGWKKKSEWEDNGRDPSQHLQYRIGVFVYASQAEIDQAGPGFQVGVLPWDTSSYLGPLMNVRGLTVGPCPVTMEWRGKKYLPRGKNDKIQKQRREAILTVADMKKFLTASETIDNRNWAIQLVCNVQLRPFAQPHASSFSFSSSSSSTSTAASSTALPTASSAEQQKIERCEKLKKKTRDEKLHREQEQHRRPWAWLVEDERLRACLMGVLSKTIRYSGMSLLQEVLLPTRAWPFEEDRGLFAMSSSLLNFTNDKQLAFFEEFARKCHRPCNLWQRDGPVISPSPVASTSVLSSSSSSSSIGRPLSSFLTESKEGKTVEVIDCCQSPEEEMKNESIFPLTTTTTTPTTPTALTAGTTPTLPEPPLFLVCATLDQVFEYVVQKNCAASVSPPMNEDTKDQFLKSNILFKLIPSAHNPPNTNPYVSHAKIVCRRFVHDPLHPVSRLRRLYQFKKRKATNTTTVKTEEGSKEGGGRGGGGKEKEEEPMADECDDSVTSYGWVYIGSHNLSQNAWGRGDVTNAFEIGVVLLVPPSPRYDAFLHFLQDASSPVSSFSSSSSAAFSSSGTSLQFDHLPLPFDCLREGKEEDYRYIKGIDLPCTQMNLQERICNHRLDNPSTFPNFVEENGEKIDLLMQSAISQELLFARQQLQQQQRLAAQRQGIIQFDDGSSALGLVPGQSYDLPRMRIDLSGNATLSASSLSATDAAFHRVSETLSRERRERREREQRNGLPRDASGPAIVIVDDDDEEKKKEERLRQEARKRQAAIVVPAVVKRQKNMRGVKQEPRVEDGKLDAAREAVVTEKETAAQNADVDSACVPVGVGDDDDNAEEQENKSNDSGAIEDDDIENDEDHSMDFDEMLDAGEYSQLDSQDKQALKDAIELSNTGAIFPEYSAAIPAAASSTSVSSSAASSVPCSTAAFCSLPAFITTTVTMHVDKPLYSVQKSLLANKKRKQQSFDSFGL